MIVQPCSICCRVGKIKTTKWFNKHHLSHTINLIKPQRGSTTITYHILLTPEPQRGSTKQPYDDLHPNHLPNSFRDEGTTKNTKRRKSSKAFCVHGYCNQKQKMLALLHQRS